MTTLYLALMDKPQLIVCGSIAIDRIMNFSGKYQDVIHHKKLDVLSVSVLVDTMQVAPGGNGANITYSLALLGETPILLGSVGKDAKSYVDELTTAGIDTSHIHFSHLPTATFNVMTDSMHNQVGGFYPGAMSDSAKLKLKPWYGKNIIMCISAHDPAAMRSQIEECRKNSIRLFYDPGQQVNNISGTDLLAGINASEVVIVNEYEHSLLCEKTRLSPGDLRKQLPLIITTHGSRGSTLEGTLIKKTIHIPSVKPSQLADPTGAGDAYRAGFLYGYLRQWELTKCGNLGAVIASLIIEEYGTRYRFSKHQVTTRYIEAFHEELTL